MEGAGTPVTVYRTKEAFPGAWDVEAGKWFPGTPFPGGYSLVPPDYPVMKPTSSPVTLIRDILKHPKNLILIGSIIAVVFFSKPLLKIAKKPLSAVKKVGRKVGIK